MAKKKTGKAFTAADPLKVPPFIGETEGQPGEETELTSTVVIANDKWAVPIEDYMIVTMAQQMERDIKRLGDTPEIAENMMGSCITGQTIINASTVIGLRVLLAHIPQESCLAKNIKERLRLHRLMLAEVMQSGGYTCSAGHDCDDESPLDPSRLN